MNSICDLNDIIEWDIPNWSVALQYWRKNTFKDLSSINALEIGGKHGGISLWAALNGMKVLCTDLEGPSNRAIEKHRKYKVSHLIEYESLNALNIPYSEKFDIVLFKSVLGGIGGFNRSKDNQIKAIDEIYKSLRKDGELWFAENLVASPFHRFFRKRYVKRENRWRYVTIEDMKTFLSRFSKIKYITVGFLGCFGQTEPQRTCFGKIDKIIIDRLVPESWRYIIIGVASK